MKKTYWIIFLIVEIFILVLSFWIDPVLVFVERSMDELALNNDVFIDYYASSINAVLYSIVWIFIFSIFIIFYKLRINAMKR